MWLAKKMYFPLKENGEVIEAKKADMLSGALKVGSVIFTSYKENDTERNSAYKVISVFPKENEHKAIEELFEFIKSLKEEEL